LGKNTARRPARGENAPPGLARRKGADDNGGHAIVQPPGAALILTLPALRASLAPGQRLLGLDPGAKIIGVALSDATLMLASPHATLKRGKLAANAAEILTLARRQEAGGLVVGLPLSMDGSLGPAAQAARDWTRALSELTGLPAALWDERLSSAAVNRFLIQEADLSRARRAQLVDRMAAAYMLQAALDASIGLGENPDA
jgi:putative holliday junction resolvase